MSEKASEGDLDGEVSRGRLGVGFSAPNCNAECLASTLPIGLNTAYIRHKVSFAESVSAKNAYNVV